MSDTAQRHGMGLTCQLWLLESTLCGFTRVAQKQTAGAAFPGFLGSFDKTGALAVSIMSPAFYLLLHSSKQATSCCRSKHMIGGLCTAITRLLGKLLPIS